jgi:hypothetical protein
VNGKGGGPIAPGVPATAGRLMIGFDVKGGTVGVGLAALEEEGMAGVGKYDPVRLGSIPGVKFGTAGVT